MVAAPEAVQILECTPPERLEVRWLEGDWHIAITVREADGITCLALVKIAIVPPAALTT